MALRFSPTILDPKNYTHPENRTLIDDLKADESPRSQFLRACLRKLGLEVSEEDVPVPSLSRLHLSSVHNNRIAELVHSFHEAGIVTEEDGDDLIKGENDTFCLEEVGRWNMASVARTVGDVIPQPVKDILPSAALPSSSTSETTPTTSEGPEAKADVLSPDRPLDSKPHPLSLVAHETALPDAKETPHFNHHAFFANLNLYTTQSLTPRESEGTWGQTLLYGEVVSSTNTLLEKNPSLLAHLPIGFLATATTQVAGRGRGSNVWVSPPGSLMFSVVLRHPIALSTSAPVVFIQYLAAIAIVEGIKSYAKGYQNLPVKLKWPNDIYALDPTKPVSEKAYVKIGGILVNSSYAGGDYTLVVGIGLNVNNTAPSVSLSQLALKASLPPFTLEKLLASILASFEEIYTAFCRRGFDRGLEAQYYGMWLHNEQIVVLEAEGGARARIKGITRDWGLLVAEEITAEGRATGKRWELMSDSNSFDFFKGLLKKKT